MDRREYSTPSESGSIGGVLFRVEGIGYSFGWYLWID